jgi:hypothetical protein
MSLLSRQWIVCEENSVIVTNFGITIPLLFHLSNALLTEFDKPEGMGILLIPSQPQILPYYYTKK